MQRNRRAAKRRLEMDAKKSALTYRGPKKETCTIPGGESRSTVAKGSKGAPVTLGRAGCPHNHPRETRAAGTAPAVALLSWVSRSGTRGAIWGRGMFPSPFGAGRAIRAALVQGGAATRRSVASPSKRGKKAQQMDKEAPAPPEHSTMSIARVFSCWQR